MLWLKIIGKILSTLKDGATPAQIALGFVLGWAIGLMPGWPVQVWLLVLILLVLQANIGMAIAGILLAGALSWILAPVLDALGGVALGIGALEGMYTAMYNSPPWALTRFNNTVVMGGFVAGLISAPVLFPLIRRGVIWYRVHLLVRISKYRLVQVILGSRIVGLYRRLQDLGLV